MRRKHQPAKSKMLAFYYDNGNNNDNNTHTHTHKSYYNTFSLLVQQMRLFSCRFFFHSPLCLFSNRIYGKVFIYYFRWMCHCYCCWWLMSLCWCRCSSNGIFPINHYFSQSYTMRNRKGKYHRCHRRNIYDYNNILWKIIIIIDLIPSLLTFDALSAFVEEKEMKNVEQSHIYTYCIT